MFLVAALNSMLGYCEARGLLLLGILRRLSEIFFRIRFVESEVFQVARLVFRSLNSYSIVNLVLGVFGNRKVYWRHPGRFCAILAKKTMLAEKKKGEGIKAAIGMKR